MKKTLLRAVALTASLSLATISPAFAGGSVGYGNFSVLDNQGALSTRLSGQNPLEEGALLICEKKCMVKSQGISLIGTDGAKMAVVSEADTYNLLVREGRVNFIINNNARKLAFITPQGTYTLAEAVFSAAGSSAVRGSVVVGPAGRTEISVMEGRLVFTTGDGIKTVDANQKLILAAIASPEKLAGLTSAQLAGIIASAFALAAVIGIGTDDGGSSFPQLTPDKPVLPPPQTGSRDSGEPPPDQLTPEDLLQPPPKPASPAGGPPPYPYD
jgi:hypothetical protein